MKLYFLLFCSLVLSSTAARSDTYIVPSSKSDATKAPKLVLSHGNGTCIYADKTIKLGDTIVLEGIAQKNIKLVLVCANSQRGPVFYPLSKIASEEVVNTVSKD